MTKKMNSASDQTAVLTKSMSTDRAITKHTVVETARLPVDR